MPAAEPWRLARRRARPAHGNRLDARPLLRSLPASG